MVLRVISRALKKDLISKANGLQTRINIIIKDHLKTLKMISRKVLKN